MRPVLLEMDGFASFRERAEVRFDETDYFALIGPTGSGKSTVIDAMTFALYGSVARWDHEGMVSPALAPTVNRGVVRLVFDVAGARYSVAREVRRSGGKNPGVGVKSVRLERFADPAALGDPDDDTVVLASDREVNGAVEKLLGLTFKHFCACVALPQGEFAEFLHAKASDRQRILVKLLGWEVYDRIARGAGGRAAEQRQRAETLTGQLDGYADATDEAVADLAGRVAALAGLNGRVAAAQPALAAAAASHRAATENVRRLTADRTQLMQVAIPADIAGLEKSRRAAVDTHTAAAQALEEAQSADDAARIAVQAAPARSGLEQTRRLWNELADVTKALPDLEKTQQLAESETRVADAAVRHTEAAATRARTASDDARRIAEEAEARADSVRSEHDRLAEVKAPEGLADIAAASERAAQLTAAASARLAAAEKADVDTRNALLTIPSAASLNDARRYAGELHEPCTAQLAASTEFAAQQRKLAQERTDLDNAAAALATAQQSVDDIERTDRALALRTHLTVGAPCPVCEQEVHAVPTSAASASIAAARAQLAAAGRDHEVAVDAVRTLERVVDRAVDSRTRALSGAELARRALIAAIPIVLDAASVLDIETVLDSPLSAEISDSDLERTALAARSVAERVDEVADVRTAAEARVADAAGELTAAKADRVAAQQAVDKVQSTAAAAREELRRTRDTLVVFGVPLVDETDVCAGWNELATWAREQAGERAAVLPELDQIAESASASRVTAATDLENAVAELERCRAAATDAKVAQQDVTTRLESRTARRDELVTLLVDGPSEEDVERKLEWLGELEADVRRTDADFRTARAEVARVTNELRAVEQKVVQARRELSRARDPLASLGAPQLDGDDLLTAWTTLVDWATAQAHTLAEQLDEVTAMSTQAERTLIQAEQALRDDLTGLGVEFDEVAVPDVPLAERASVLVATALARAEGEHHRVTERVVAATALRSEIQTAQDEARVAKLLADLMRSDAFQRWLVASAIDTLVEEASASLFELSGGQFDLCHVDGAFHVIDHNEADSPRPVKTLSGGETFQASLALALALSSQIRALAVDGAAELDSIFLDEGFGTLDEETLDTVASTLENLATSRSRMVGVITHISALAERVPVRFLVTRDATSSRVVREAL
ncbi:AAA family ATPase [Lentzea terrae]|uniref:AAA family ATPase n=1 Tax=Lentzea terrae TaxID=2200761 RepID=UPI0018E57DFA|nr:SMC family ATPase [Lentzea terrae]